MPRNVFDIFVDWCWSPVPPIVVALIGVCVSYFGTSLYKYSIYYTGLIIALGFIGSFVIGLICYATSKSASDGAADGFLTLAPIGMALLNVCYFWLALFGIHLVLEFSKFLM